MATNVRKIDNLDVPFKEFMPGQIIQSGQFNDDMKDIEDKVNEIIGEQNTLVDEVNAHTDNFENPHQVTAHQTGTYTSQEIDEFVEDIKSGNLHDNAIGNRVLDDDCVSTRNILDGSITSSKLDGSVGSQIDISTNVSIKDRYTKEETDLLIQEKVGSGTYDKATIDEKLEQIQAGQILDKSISIHQLKDDVGRRLDISNNPDILNKYTRDEVDLLIQNNALPRDWGSILEEDDDTPVVIPTKEITLPVANHMKANTFTVSESSILDIDIQENVDARGEFDTVGERLDSVDSQIKDKANKSDVKNKYYDVEQDLITNNNLSNMIFKRKHTRNLYKNVKYNMCGMDFTRDFINIEDGNMYPQQNYLTNDYGTLLTEEVSDFKYKLRNDTTKSESSKRLIGCINLFSTYEITIEDIVTKSSLGVRCGLNIRNSIDLDKYDVFIAFTNENKLEVRSEMYLNDVSQGVITNYSESFTESKLTVLFTVTDSFIEVYKKINNNITFLCNIDLPRKLNAIETLADTKVNLFTRLNVKESVSYSLVENYYDCGISQGDMKIIRYKDGSTLIKNGRVYFTMSSRFQKSAYQTVISQNLSGCDYKLEGIILYTTDGVTINRDFASSIKYDNDTGKFLIWNTSFTNRHCLCYGEAFCDITNGINIVKMTPMSEGLVNDTDFKAKDLDEDPDFIYDYKNNKWYLIICRMVYDTSSQSDTYRYFLFESDNPFTGYVFKDKTLSGANTGGSIVKVGNILYLVCGSNYHTTSQYNVYKLNDLSTYTALKKDYEDGGYRGWGTIFSIPCGNFTKYGWITFDRDNASEHKWSYGNIYYYESDLLNDGCEYNVKHSY